MVHNFSDIFLVSYNLPILILSIYHNIGLNGKDTLRQKLKYKSYFRRINFPKLTPVTSIIVITKDRYVCHYGINQSLHKQRRHFTTGVGVGGYMPHFTLFGHLNSVFSRLCRPLTSYFQGGFFQALKYMSINKMKGVS